MQQTNPGGGLDAQLYGPRQPLHEPNLELTLILRVLHALYRARFVIMLGAALGIVGATLFVRQAEEEFTSTALVMIDTRTRPEAETGNVVGFLPTSLTALESELEVLRSTDLLQRVSDRLDLMRDPEFGPLAADDAAAAEATEPGPIQAAVGALKDVAVNVRDAVFPPTTVDPGLAAEAELMKALQERRTIEQIGEVSSVYAIGFQSNDREKASLIANTIAEEYLAGQQAAKVETANQLIVWLENRAAEISTQLEGLERQLAAKELEPPYGNESVLDNERRQRYVLETQVNEVRARGGNTASLQARLDDIRERLRTYADYEVAKRGIENEIEVARRTYAEISTQLTLSPQQLLNSDSQIVAHARPSLEPTSPQKKLWLAAGGFLGIFLFAGLAMLRELMHNRMRTVNDFEDATHLPVIGLTPALKGQSPTPRRFSSYKLDPSSTMARALRRIRSRIAADPGPSRVIGITSSLSREGKSTTLTFLAQSFASAGENVLVIDCDMARERGIGGWRRPKKTGRLSELTKHPEIINQQLVEVAPNVTMLKAKVARDDDRDLIISDDFHEFIRAFADHYDRVLVDMPPLLPALDLAPITKVADVLIFVSRWNVTPVSGVRTALRALTEIGVKPFGVVATMVSEHKAVTYAQDLFAFIRSNDPRY